MDENGKVVPQEVKGWNWGAFMFNIFWGIGNKTYLPLLCLIPIFNVVWCSLSASKATVGPGKKAITKTLRHSKLFKQLGIEPVSSNLFYQLF